LGIDLSITNEKTLPNFIGEFMISEPIHVNDAAFEKAVLQSTVPVIVDFWAPWCGPCKTIAPILDKLAKDYSGKIIVAKMNVDENPTVPAKYGVQNIPTMLFFANGKILHQNVGAAPEYLIKQMIDQFLEVVNPKK
jgi:thioredoxin 1